MKTPFAIGAILIASSVSIYATGGDWYDEPPPRLQDSLDMLPAKSFGQIYLETSPKKKTDSVSYDDIRAIAKRLPGEKPEKLLPEVDKLIARARENYDDGGDMCNLLHDVHDVLVSTAANPAAARDYILWRVEHDGWITGGLPANHTSNASEGSTEDPTDKAVDKKSEEIRQDLEKQLKAAPDSLKVHWLYLMAAHQFKLGDRDSCDAIFESIVRDNPTHPRAEIALFMTGRCALSHSRGNPDDDQQDEKKLAPERAKVVKIFEEYLKKYPRGRFISDAYGWMGAAYFDGDEYMKALEAYIAQGDTPGHPETMKSAVFMIEKTLSHMVSGEDAEAAFALVARHPRVAMGLMYFVLSAPEKDNYDGKYDRPADVKKWRKATLPRIAAQVVKQKELYKAEDWQPRYLAMLALAASETGDQKQALQLTEIDPALLESSDDLLFARALAQQRAARGHDAVETFKKLFSKFPDSPLVGGARIRYALALQDDHQAGGAVVQLYMLLKKGGDESPSYGPFSARYSDGSVYPEDEAGWEPGTSSVFPNISGADSDQIEQIVDGLLNFAPVTELAAALDSKDLDEAGKIEMRKILATRYLAQEDFAAAKKFMTEAEYGLVAAKLEKLATAANSAKDPKEKAAAMLRLGDAWAAAREKLLMAALDVTIPFTSQPAYDGIARRENAKALGYANFDTELEDRDELRHASRWWMRAARSLPATQISATARWKALDAMVEIAKASEYAELRAREIHGNTVARELYDKLRSESPDSVEAKRYAAYWSFPEPKPAKSKDGGEETSDTNVADDREVSEESGKEANALGYVYTDCDAFGIKTSISGDGDSDTDKDFSDRVLALREHAASWDPARMAVEVRKLDAIASSSFHNIEDAACRNMLDDLVQFYSGEKISPEVQKTYVNIRMDVLHRCSWGSAPDPSPTSGEANDANDTDEAVMKEIEATLKDPAMRPVADYLEFCRIGMVAGMQTQVDTGIVDKGDDHFTFASRDYAKMEEMTRAFLKKYPHSRKREAAMFVLARSIYALSRPYVYSVFTPLPGASKDSDLTSESQQTYQVEPFTPKRVLGALDDYDREFAKGRYASDIRGMRANVLWRMHEWGQALDLTLGLLADKKEPGLQSEASLLLANIFAQLEDAQYRADLLKAVKERPKAASLLKQFLDKATDDRTHPLRYLQNYLGDQLKS